MQVVAILVGSACDFCNRITIKRAVKTVGAEQDGFAPRNQQLLQLRDAHSVGANHARGIAAVSTWGRGFLNVIVGLIKCELRDFALPLIPPPAKLLGATVANANKKPFSVRLYPECGKCCCPFTLSYPAQLLLHDRFRLAKPRAERLRVTGHNRGRGYTMLCETAGGDVTARALAHAVGTRGMNGPVRHFNDARGVFAHGVTNTAT